jgi:hypothetical protein
MSEIVKKKRGRKPKNLLNIIKNDLSPMIENNIISDEEKVIFHLPITINEINNNEPEMSLFIKNENEIKNTLSETDSLDSLKTSLISSQTKIILNNSVNKITTHLLNFTKNTKCWWCRNPFNTPAVQLPEDYFNETFYCIGNFCGFSCMKSFNLDLNDSLLSKRESLMNLLFFQTYGEYKQITSAPHWMALDDYGGNLTIEQFRENSIVNSKEFLVLHPPLISRQMQIEESYKLNKLKEVPIDNINRIYSEIDTNYTIKRSKPVQSTQLNLETTMGLVKTKKKISKF